VTFFDRDNDGVITLSDTYSGLRALGFGGVASSGMAFAINGALGSSTGASWYAPFSIYVDQIHLGKHGSDTGIYDSNGDYVQSAFDDMFLNYDGNQDGELSEEEFEDLYEGQYTDSSGTSASRAEFSILFSLASEVRLREVEVYGSAWDGSTEMETQEYSVLTRNTLERFYNGALFYELAGEPIPF
jgi:peroxygenase